MTRALESRLAKLEQGRHVTPEEWLDRLAGLPPLTEAESAAMDAEIEAEAIGEFGSLAAAAEAAGIKAERTSDPLDDLLAADMECRAKPPVPKTAMPQSSVGYGWPP